MIDTGTGHEMATRSSARCCYGQDSAALGVNLQARFELTRTPSGCIAAACSRSECGGFAGAGAAACTEFEAALRTLRPAFDTVAIYAARAIPNTAQFFEELGTFVQECIFGRWRF